MKQLSLLFLLYLFAGPASSQDVYSTGFSPWCLVRDEAESCNYGTPEDCYASALARGGYCRENARRAGLSGELPWCIVNSRGRNCNFYTQEQCMNIAVRDNAGCVYNTERELQKSAARKESLGLITEVLEEDGQRQLVEQLREAAGANPGGAPP